MYFPVAGAGISSDFEGGFRSTGGHSGVDFAGRGPIRAAVPGTVISAEWGGAYGNLVKVRHTDGSIGYYAHMARMSVRPGMRVSRGSILGIVGNTGNVRGRNGGYHLHFEVRRNGRPVNPMPWLARDYRAVSGDAKDARASFSGGRSVKGLSAEQLRNARTIIAVGRSMGASQRDLLIALMTAYQESKFQNLNYGDRDSVGLFQQRAGWGSRSQRMNPQFSARMFFSGGVRGPGTPGLLEIGRRGRMSLTGAAQAVQRSAFPNAYAQWEGLARSILGGGTGIEAPLEEEPMGLEGFEEEPLDGMVPRTAGGGFPLDAVHLPGVSGNRSTNEPGLKELLYG